ncbi:MAG: DUF106 domain-containing protein [Halobacteriaceae archaeon]
MARTTEKVRSLLSEDPEMEDALKTILDRSEGDELEWSDVNDSLTSGQWGRLIETGILKDGDEGFYIEDPEAVKEGIEGPEIEYEAELPDKDVSWSKWDKIAAAAVVPMFLAYMIPWVRNIVGNVMDLFLGPLDNILPFYAVIMILAVLTGLYSSLLQANLMDMEVISAYQARMQEVQEMQKKAREQGDKDAMQEARQEQMEAMTDNMGMFKEQFRPMVWIMVLTIPVFLWMYWIMLEHPETIDTQIVLPLVGKHGMQEAVLGPIQTWILWYFLCSLGFSNIIRKSLNVQTTPT